jgi:hypothetical protein
VSQRRLTRQQVVGDADPLLRCAGRQMEDKLRAERENAAHSTSAPLKEDAAVRGSRLDDSHRYSWHARAASFSLAKGEFDSGGHESAEGAASLLVLMTLLRNPLCSLVVGSRESLSWRKILWISS